MSTMTRHPTAWRRYAPPLPRRRHDTARHEPEPFHPIERPLATFSPSALGDLQRTAGNRATATFVQRSVEHVQRRGCGGGSCACGRCRGQRDADELPSAGPGGTAAVQRNAQGAVVQRVRCGLVPAATCAAPIAGDPEEFSRSEAAVEAGPRDRRARMSSARQMASGHTGRARQLELILEAEFPGQLANVHGIFIDADMSSGTAAFVDVCSNMVPPIPAPADKKCTFVPGELNRQALQFRQRRPLVGGRAREDWRVETLQTLVHEIQHVSFEAAALGQPAGVAAAACARTDVEFELSELAAIMSEFPVAFRAIPAGAPVGHPARIRLTNWFNHAISSSGESIEGALIKMRCTCGCAEVDSFVKQTFTHVSASWTVPERLTFNTILRDPARGLHWPL